MTELLGGENYVSCSVVLPAFCHLNRIMDLSDEDPGYMIKFQGLFHKGPGRPQSDPQQQMVEASYRP